MPDAKGFCTCKRDAPGRPHLHPAPGAAWHYLCDKPVLPAPAPTLVPTGTGLAGGQVSMWRCEDCGWQWPLADVPWQDAECDACGGEMRLPAEAEDELQPLHQWRPIAAEVDPPEYGPDDAEAQRIAETFADANAEHDRIEAEERTQ